MYDIFYIPFLISSFKICLVFASSKWFRRKQSCVCTSKMGGGGEGWQNIDSPRVRGEEEERTGDVWYTRSPQYRCHATLSNSARLFFGPEEFTGEGRTLFSPLASHRVTP